ncbi:Protein SMG8, partial [Trichoplax sp. H2]
ITGQNKHNHCMVMTANKQTDIHISKYLRNFLPNPSSISDTDEICVVSIIGKTPLNYLTCGTLADAVSGRNVFQRETIDDNDQKLEHGLLFYYNDEQKVVYINQASLYDTKELAYLCQKFNSDLSTWVYTIAQQEHFQKWKRNEHKQLLSLLFIFSISHIILITHPSHKFDLSYLRLFRGLNAIRLHNQSVLTHHLCKIAKAANLSSQWRQRGRCCTPRLLFIFHLDININRRFQDGNRSKNRDVGQKDQSLITQKRLQKNLEKQICNLFKEASLHGSQNPLFTIPTDQQFVFVQTVSTLSSYHHTSNAFQKLLPNVQDATSLFFNIGLATTLFQHFYVTQHDKVDDNDVLEKNFDEENSDLKNFLKYHINQTKAGNVCEGQLEFLGSKRSHHHATAVKLPTSKTWFTAASYLQKVLIEDVSGVDSIRYPISSSWLDIDKKFSESTCRKAISVALDCYEKNLPEQYNYAFHQKQLATSINTLSQLALGPSFPSYVQQLEKDCEKIWKNGRQSCEILSLTGKQCIYPLHDSTDDKPETDKEIKQRKFRQSKNLPQKRAHSSNYWYISACNCGETIAKRPDPFDIKVANCTFYQMLEKKCCSIFPHISFPVNVDSNSHEEQSIDDHAMEIEEISAATSSKNNADSSNGVADDPTLDGLDTTTAVGQNSEFSSSPSPAPAANLVSMKIELDNCKKDGESSNSIIMFTINTPAGYLPRFSSWSLCRLGDNNIYKASKGLFQSGFLPGTNFLCPWIISRSVLLASDPFESTHELFFFRMIEQFPTIAENRGKSSGRYKKENSVKAYIGIEYECPHGDRFFYAGSNKVIRSSNNLKEIASKLTSSELPLYFPCPCGQRSSKTVFAQCMRIYVASPMDSDIRVILRPFIQPGTDHRLVFYSGFSQGISLPPNGLWCLRLPFVYGTENETIYPPTDPKTPSKGRILKGLFHITAIVSDTSQNGKG